MKHILESCFATKFQIEKNEFSSRIVLAPLRGYVLRQDLKKKTIRETVWTVCFVG